MNETELIDAIKNSKSKSEILIKWLGYVNKSAYLKLDKFVESNQIDMSHLEKMVKYCLKCGKMLSNNRNKFCSRSCSAAYTQIGKVHSDETKHRISESLIGSAHIRKSVPKMRKCVICDTEYVVHRKPNGLLSKNKCCSTECRITFNSNTSKHNMAKFIATGNHKGWVSRNITSYPEKFFIDVLNNNNIEFTHNYSISQRELGIDTQYSYFLDFYIADKKIDLEIDGNQHRFRQESDMIRDGVLENNGYIVYRIKWKNINTETGKQYIQNEINKFLDFYKNLI
jgi:very-short-patch-repair endonuclease